ncbi:MAG: ABC transporter permease [Eubacteriales bacterium]|nr:ABC transporter permease [Eubacteriales bacterium]
MELVISTLEQGMIYGIMALGVYITYKILDFPDLTVDGSFPLGASVTAILITKGVPALLTLPVCFLVGALAGVCTGLIHVKLKVRDLLSGIIMMTALYTVNLRIAGRANLPFYKESTVFDNRVVNRFFESGFGTALAPWRTVLVMVLITAVVKLFLDGYLKTGSGYLLRAVGDNPSIVTAMGQDRGKIKILGLAVSNGLVTLAGCLFAQQQRFFEISSGTGAVVIGLASVIIGTSLYRRLESTGKLSGILHSMRIGMLTLSVLAGSVIYKACISAALHFADPKDLKLITAVLFLIVLVVSMERKGKKHA